MSRVTNLNRYSLQHCFYPRRGALPHEFKSWFVWLINFSSDHGFHVNYVRTLKNIRFSYVVYINVVLSEQKIQEDSFIVDVFTFIQLWNPRRRNLDQHNQSGSGHQTALWSWIEEIKSFILSRFEYSLLFTNEGYTPIFIWWVK